MTWSDLCNGAIESGKGIDLNTLIGPGVEHNRRHKTGMPASAALREMVRAAQRLPLKGTKGKGIEFHIAGCVEADGGLQMGGTWLKTHLSSKPGASGCYEDLILPINKSPGHHVLVHQSVAPCKRCRAGYKAWAGERVCTIIVSADDGYDQSGDDKVFVFTPTGLVFFG